MSAKSGTLCTRAGCADGDDPKRAAFRDGVRHLLYRGGDAVPAEDVGLKLAPYRLGPGVPELALSVDGKVDPLPE